MLWNAKSECVSLDKARMDCVRFGSGGKNLIILPGLSDGLAGVRGKELLLAPPFRAFFERYTVWMFSRRDPLPSAFSIADMAADQAEALRVLGIERAAVMGVSQGGMIAQLFAADYPERTEALILAVTAPYANETVRACVTGWIRMAEKGDHKSLIRKAYPLLGMLGKPKSYARFLTNARAILAFDARPALERIVCPTLILGGEEDRIVGAEASCELHRAIAGSELFLYPSLGHAAYEEAKDFNERVYRFLEG